MASRSLLHAPLQISNAPELHPELLDRILRMVNKQTLFSCALVRSSWLPFAQALLWNTLCLNINKLPLRHVNGHSRFTYEPDFKPLVDLLGHSPGLAEHVRVLVIHGGKQLQPFVPTSTSTSPSTRDLELCFDASGISEVARRLPALRQVELRNVHLRLPHVAVDPANALPLELLTVHEDIECATDGPDAANLLHLLDLFDPYRLVLAMRTDPRQPHTLQRLPAAPSSLQLRTRRVTSISIQTSDPVTMSMLMALSREPCGQNLTTLDIRLTYPGDVPLLSSVLMTSGHNIRSLHVDVGWSLEYSSPPFYTSAGLSALSLAPCKKLERLETSVVASVSLVPAGTLVAPISPNSVCAFIRTVDAPLQQLVLKLYLSFDDTELTWRTFGPHLLSLDTALSTFEQHLQSVTLVFLTPSPSNDKSTGQGSAGDALASCFVRNRRILRIESTGSSATSEPENQTSPITGNARNFPQSSREL